MASGRRWRRQVAGYPKLLEIERQLPGGGEEEEGARQRKVKVWLVRGMHSTLQSRNSVLRKRE